MKEFENIALLSLKDGGLYASCNGETDVSKRIRILFINCPTLCDGRAAYLILAQNHAQAAIQFEVHHFWAYGQISQGPLAGRFNRLLEKIEDKYPRFGWPARRNRSLRDLRAAPSFRETSSMRIWNNMSAKR